MAKRTKKPLESAEGSYFALPHKIINSVAYMGASHLARSLLSELLVQHNGANNGHLQLTTTWLKRRGWSSAGQIAKGRDLLIERKLIVRTRLGGLNAGADHFALTWLPITNFVGLDIRQNDYQKGDWSLLEPLPSIGSKGRPAIPIVTKRVSACRTVKRKDHSAERNSTVPPNGIASIHAVPSSGTKTAISEGVAVPSSGNNEYIPLPTRKTSRRIVGKAGRSGTVNRAIEGVK